MRIEQIEIRNYRVFRDVKLTRLPPMTVIIGANGTAPVNRRCLTSFPIF